MTKRVSLILFSLILVTAGMLAFGVSQAAAQDPKPTPSDDEVNRVAKQMFCPVCENIPLDVCPTQACHDWRELIRLKLADGWSDQQIRTYFAQQYGDRVLAEPPRKGINLAFYIVPWLALAAGVYIVWRVLTTMTRKSQAQAPAAPAEQPSAPHDDAYTRRLEEELRRKE